MRKFVFVVVLAAVMIAAFAVPAMAVGPFFNTSIEATAGNANYPNYLSWAYSVASLDNTGTPHNSYSTTTNKCQVCHAVHRAEAGGSLMLPVPQSVDMYNGGYSQGCIWCHSGLFAVYVPVTHGDQGGGPVLGTHADCTYCHSTSPHGARLDSGAAAQPVVAALSMRSLSLSAPSGPSTPVYANSTGQMSKYPVLQLALLNDRGDAAIAADIASGNNGVVAAQFDLSDATLQSAGRTLGMGYLCAYCHSDTAEGPQMAFAVNAPNAQPSLATESNDLVRADRNTGHRVTAVVTNDWNRGSAFAAAPDVRFDPSVATQYNAFYTGSGAVGANSQIAWAPSNGCESCHDARLASGQFAFPHGYVNNTGDPVSVGTVGASIVWLSTGASATDVRTVLPGPAGGRLLPENTNAMNDLLTNDGLCLKCHVDTGTDAGGSTAGVSLSY